MTIRMFSVEVSKLGPPALAVVQVFVPQPEDESTVLEVYLVLPDTPAAPPLRSARRSVERKVEEDEMFQVGRALAEKLARAAALELPPDVRTDCIELADFRERSFFGARSLGQYAQLEAVAADTRDDALRRAIVGMRVLRGLEGG